MGGAFQVNSLVEYEEDVDTTLNALLRRVRENPSCSLYRTMQLYQLDFLFKFAFGEDLGNLQQGKDILGMTRLTYLRAGHWVAWQAIPVIEYLLFQNPIWDVIRAKPPKWAQMGAQKLQTRLLAPVSAPKSSDLLQKCIDGREKHPDILAPETVGRLINSIIAAGSDTTAATLTTALYFLVKNPDKLRLLRRELDEHAQKGLLSMPPRWSEVKKLPYLDAVIKEALRLNPPLPTTLERVVPPQGFIIDGIHIPGGTVVGCMPLLVHLDQNCFGCDAENFNPERWLDLSREKVYTMESASLIWGAGSRICLGRHVAELELKKVIPALLSAFEVGHHTVC